MSDTVPDTGPQGTRADWITDRVLRGLIWAALRLPLRTRLWLVAGLVKRVIAPLAGYRKRAMANLAHVFPDMPPAEQRRIADAVADNAGRTLIENYDVHGLRDRMADVPLSGPGVAEIEKARAEGRPVLFVTGHFGNFEAPRAALVARGYEIGGLYRPMSNAFFNITRRTCMLCPARSSSRGAAAPWGCSVTSRTVAWAFCSSMSTTAPGCPSTSWTSPRRP